MQELPVINRTQELYEASIKVNDKLPALRRQTIGKRLEDNILRLLELLIMAKHALEVLVTVHLTHVGQVFCLSFDCRLKRKHNLS